MLPDVLFVVALIILLWDGIGLIDRLYDLRRHGFAIGPGYLTWRTRRGLGFIDRLARVSKRGWRAYGTLAAGIGATAMVFTLTMFVLNFIFMMANPQIRLPGVVLVYPGLIPWLPVIPWIIAITSVLLVHEFSHGILLRAQGLRVKSAGVAMFGVVLGAFVEPNEKQLMEASPAKRMRMFAVGSMANFVLAAACLAALVVILVPKQGIYLYAVSENYAENFTLGSRIYQLDNVPVNTLDECSNILENRSPGEEVWVVTENERVLVALAQSQENENAGELPLLARSAVSWWDLLNPVYLMGVTALEILGQPVFHPYFYEAQIPWAVVDVLKWMFILNLGVGLFNTLPAVPFDGGYFVQAALERRTSKERARGVVRTLSYVIFVLILLNMFPLFLR
jgi:membrane-associated protease RseP (regulator of RpoE activity)